MPEEENAVAKTGRKFGWRGVIVMLVLIAANRVGTHGQTSETVGPAAALNDTRVRAEDPALSTLIRQAIDQSATFRGLVEAIQATDGIVYVIHGRCGHYVRACLLLWMAGAGPNRMLRVVVDTSRQADIETMALIGHELKHALEVLAEPRVKTGAGMFHLYGPGHKVQGVFETKAAIEAGDAVYNELRRRRKN
jgi:hypothetical protein